jgi:hypothetical protein
VHSDPKFNWECVNNEQIQETEFINKVATRKYGTKHSAEVTTELTEYCSKEGFFVDICFHDLHHYLVERSVLWFKISKSCSTYSIAHTAERNRLTQERAGKLTYIAHNLKLSRNAGDSLTKHTGRRQGGESQEQERQGYERDEESMELKEEHDSYNTDDMQEFEQ